MLRTGLPCSASRDTRGSRRCRTQWDAAQSWLHEAHAVIALEREYRIPLLTQLFHKAWNTHVGARIARIGAQIPDRVVKDRCRERRQEGREQFPVTPHA